VEQTPTYAYRDVLADPRLVALIEQGLAHNQDIAQAVANVQAAQAQFRIPRRALPRTGCQRWLDPLGRRPRAGHFQQRQGRCLQCAGRGVVLRTRPVRAAARSDGGARASYLGTQAAARSARLSVVSSIATGWLAYAADTSLLKLAHDTETAARTACN
jgi:multidrug efflux system outer membrane protein